MNAEELEELLKPPSFTIAEIWDSGKDCEAYCAGCQIQRLVLNNSDGFRCRGCERRFQPEQKAGKIIENRMHEAIEDKFSIKDYVTKFTTLRGVTVHCARCQGACGLDRNGNRFYCAGCGWMQSENKIIYFADKLTKKG
jgi:hypothetical protein